MRFIETHHEMARKHALAKGFSATPLEADPLTSPLMEYRATDVAVVSQTVT